MLSIGDFAHLGGVSVRTLRHYDEIGLLRPARVDPHSGYRAYSAGQLGQLNRIVALKDLGLSLAQVRRLIGGITLEELRGMLMLRRAQLDGARGTQVSIGGRSLDGSSGSADIGGLTSGCGPAAEVINPRQRSDQKEEGEMSSVESITPTAVVRRVFERLNDRDVDALPPFWSDDPRPP
jgi:DNA-binding transcriptional MerR regulator